MIINGTEYGFSYTVEAYLIVEGLQWKEAKTSAEQAKRTMQLAVIMSKAHEDRKAFLEPNYEPHYLTSEQVMQLTVGQFSKLSEEVDEAFKRDTKKEVETVAVRVKKKLGMIKGR